MPNLDLQNHYLNLVNNKVSDFKLELGRVKDEYTSAISYLQKYHLDEARENNNNYTISLLSDEDKTVDYFTKKEQKFSNAIDRINNLISFLDLDENFKIKKSIDFDISAFLDIFISDYGLVKFYKNTKDQILLDFDNMFSADLAEPKPEPSAVPGASEPAKPRSISIFDTSAEKSSPLDKTKAKDTKAPEVSVGQEVDVKQLSTQDRINIESAEDQACALPSSEDLSNTKDQKYEGLYYIRSFALNLKFGKKVGKRDFFAGVTPDGKWLASKSGALIFGKSELVTENKIRSFAVKAINERPNGFIDWNQTGGALKRTFFENLPQIETADSKKKDKNKHPKTKKKFCINIS